MKNDYTNTVGELKKLLRFAIEKLPEEEQADFMEKQIKHYFRFHAGEGKYTRKRKGGNKK